MGITELTEYYSYENISKLKGKYLNRYLGMIAS